ncbi:MAG: adenylate kinase family protein [Nanoarchaeota archaeon]|nr:adenylate kinase family protein [Nanoarchaeota archaeon]
MRFILAITGTPGTGKSELAKELSLLLGCHLIGLTAFIKEHDLSEGYDEQRDCQIVDSKSLNERLGPILKKAREDDKSVIVEGHLSQVMDPSLFDFCIVLHCSPAILKRRLEERKYSAEKIKENLECENLDICGNEAEESGFKVLTADSSKTPSRAIARQILKKILENSVSLHP